MEHRRWAICSSRRGNSLRRRPGRDRGLIRTTARPSPASPPTVIRGYGALTATLHSRTAKEEGPSITGPGGARPEDGPWALVGEGSAAFQQPAVIFLGVMNEQQRFDVAEALAGMVYPDCRFSEFARIYLKNRIL